MMKWLFISLVLASQSMAASGLTTNQAASAYDAALQLYWKNDLAEAAQQLAGIASQFPHDETGQRADYMLGVIEKKMASNELATVRKKIAEQYPVLTAWHEARDMVATNASAAAFQKLGTLVLSAPPVWRTMALRRIASTTWPDPVATSDPDLLALIVEDVTREMFVENPAGVTKLRNSLLSFYVARAEYAKQAALRRRMFAENPTTDGAMNIIALYRRASLEREAADFFAEVLPSVSNAAAFASAYALVLAESRQFDAAFAALASARTAGQTNTALLVITQAQLCEKQFDFRGALAVLQTDATNPAIEKALNELRLRLPEHYEPLWNVPLSSSVDLGVDAKGVLFALVIPQNSYGGQPSRILQLKADGRIEQEIPVGSSSGSARNFSPYGFVRTGLFAVLPEDGFLINQHIVTRRGEIARSLDVAMQPSSYGGLSARGCSTSAGELLVASAGQGLFRFKPDGTPVFKAMDPESFRRPGGIALAGTNIVVIEGTTAIFYDLAGKKTRTLAVPLGMDERMSEPMLTLGLRADASGLLYLWSAYQRCVKIFDSELNFLTQIPSISVESVAVSPDGSIFIAHDGGQVLKYAPKDGGARALLKKLR